MGVSSATHMLALLSLLLPLGHCVLLHVADVSMVPLKFACKKFVLLRSARVKFASVKIALVRSLPARLVSVRSLPVRLAPVKVELEKFTWAKVLSTRYASVKLTPSQCVLGAKYTDGNNAVGPSKYPVINRQLSGRLAGVPVLPHDATLVNVALLKFVSFRFAPVKFVPVRFVLTKMAPVMTAFCKSNVLRFAPVRLAVGPIR